MKINTTYNIDCIEGAKMLPDNSVNCIITSPPYYGLRDYGHNEQIGMEASPEEYISKLVTLFRELRRVLRNDGTLWIVIGDSYAGGGNARGQKSPLKGKQATNKGASGQCSEHQKNINPASFGCKPKDLIGIPFMLAFALRADGWYLRQDIIWHKPNPMPESVTDRCGKSHEYIFLLSRSKKYYFDNEAIKQPVMPATTERCNQNIENQKGSDRAVYKSNGRMKAVIGGRKRQTVNEKLTAGNLMHRNNSFKEYEYGMYANKRSVWTVPTMPFKDAHFAVYPEKLITDCIKAGCPENGIVLDPFHGAGTTGIVANKLNRNYIGLELNPDYIEIENKRRHREFGLFKL